MLSILQQFSTSPPRLQTEKTRQQTIESAFSRMTAHNASNNTSTPPSLTTSTSVTDGSSEPTDEFTTSDEKSNACSPAKIGAPDSNVESTGRETLSPQKSGAVSGTRTVSGETLVDSKSESREQLLRDSVQALDGDWELGSMPGDNLKRATQNDYKVKGGDLKRLDVLERASSLMKRTKNVLGKRGRDTVDAGIEKIQALTGRKRSSLRHHVTQAPPLESPVMKRPRFSQAELKKAASPPPAIRRKPVKRQKKQWLSQGLYVGQDRNFNARLTESQNNLRKKPGQLDTGLRKANTIMPLPMFAGQRILELGRPFKLPFEVFSPLPPGQPKPDEWKKTHKNVFVGDAANVWKKAPALEHSTCLCTPKTGCDEDCMNRFMLYECDDSNCNIGAELCSNRPFAELKRRCKAGGKYNIGVEVMKTIGRGYGIRANRTFEPNQIIVEYTGEIITQEECDERMHKRYKDAECYYLMDFDQSMILDATRGSIARFVNHSCAPNCRMIKWTVQGKPRMALFAGDNGVMTGEELTYDYNFNPYSVKNVQECRCGAEGCRGVLGPKPKEIREALNPLVGVGKRKFQTMVEDAVEGAMDAVGVKRRKINVPKGVKNALASVKAEKKEKPKPKVKPLPKGWVYPEEAPEFKKVNEIDPETILRGKKRKAKEELDAEGASDKKRRTISGVTLSGTEGNQYNSRRRSSTKIKKEGIDDDDARQISRPRSMKAKASSVRKNVVRTIKKGNRGIAGKSIRVIQDQ
ncbi:MAG: hypothetical protein Q9217_005487 [Psora testacea]